MRHGVSSLSRSSKSRHKGSSLYGRKKRSFLLSSTFPKKNSWVRKSIVSNDAVLIVESHSGNTSRGGRKAGHHIPFCVWTRKQRNLFRYQHWVLFPHV